MCSIHLTFWGSWTYLTSSCREQTEKKKTQRRDSHQRDNWLKLRLYQQNPYSIIWSPISSPISSFSLFPSPNKGRIAAAEVALFSPLPFMSASIFHHLHHDRNGKEDTRTQRHTLMHEDIIKGPLLKHWGSCRAGIYLPTINSRKAGFTPIQGSWNSHLYIHYKFAGYHRHNSHYESHDCPSRYPFGWRRDPCFYFLTLF